MATINGSGYWFSGQSTGTLDNVASSKFYFAGQSTGNIDSVSGINHTGSVTISCISNTSDTARVNGSGNITISCVGNTSDTARININSRTTIACLSTVSNTSRINFKGQNSIACLSTVSNTGRKVNNARTTIDCISTFSNTSRVNLNVTIAIVCLSNINNVDRVNVNARTNISCVSAFSDIGKINFNSNTTIACISNVNTVGKIVNNGSVNISCNSIVSFYSPISVAHQGSTTIICTSTLTSKAFNLTKDILKRNRPNRFIKNLIYQLKKYNKESIILQQHTRTQNSSTGVTTDIIVESKISSIVLPIEQLKLFSHIPSNTRFNFGGTHSINDPIILVDSKNLPANYILNDNDTIILDDKLYQIKDYIDYRNEHLVVFIVEELIGQIVTTSIDVITGKANKFLQQIFYQLKKYRKETIILRIRNSIAQNSSTGASTIDWVSHVIKQAILLPVSQIKSFSKMLSNERFNFGGTYKVGDSLVLVDRNNLPDNYMLNQNDTILFDAKLYQLKKIKDYRDNRLVAFIVEELVGQLVN